jgi:nicotinamidase-related amidase
MTPASPDRGTARVSTLTPERCVIVVVDLQEKLLPAIHGSGQVLRNGIVLLRLAQALGLPVVLTSQYRKGLGDVVPEVRAAAPGIEPLDKVAFGCFGSEAFTTRLGSLRGRDQLLVAGIEAHICVAQTVLGALQRGYEVHVASDAVGSRSDENRRVGLDRMQRSGAVLSSTEMAAYELLGRSDSPAFKEMLPHFKA